MLIVLRLALVGFVFWATPVFAQNREPTTYSECDAIYARELKRFAAQTNRDLRQTQSKASLLRMRCERAVERKIIQSRAKNKTR
jgi:predicted phosphohydrolase